MFLLNGSLWPSIHNYIPSVAHGRPEAWPLDGTGVEARYEDGFYKVIKRSLRQNPSGFFGRLLQKRAQEGLSTHVLDLFGSGFFIETPALTTSITGLRWGPYYYALDRPTKRKPSFHPEYVLGDIFYPNTWKNLDLSMTQRNISAFDLVTMLPEGGWRHHPVYRSVQASIQALDYIIKRVVVRLSDRGQFFFKVEIAEYPGVLTNHPQIKELVRVIEENTKFRLIIFSHVYQHKKTFELEGALLPK